MYKLTLKHAAAYRMGDTTFRKDMPVLTGNALLVGRAKKATNGRGFLYFEVEQLSEPKKRTRRTRKKVELDKPEG